MGSKLCISAFGKHTKKIERGISNIGAYVQNSGLAWKFRFIEVQQVLVIKKTFSERANHFFGNLVNIPVPKPKNKILSRMDAQFKCKIGRPVFQFPENSAIPLKLVA